MISRVSGVLERVEPDRVVVSRNGLCFEVLIPASAMEELLPKQGQEVSLETICYLQGNLQSGQFYPVLVGFLTEGDRGFFEVFTSVGGIGTRAALKALVRPCHEVALAIEREDYAFLSSLPGIGKQKAAKIVAELKGKAARFAVGRPDEGAREGASVRARQAIEGLYEDALGVLVQLGHRQAEAERMLQEVTDELAAEGREGSIRGPEDLIREVYRLKNERASRVRA